MLRTCMSTVRGLRNRSCAISRFVRPTASRRTTSRSRRDRPPPSASAAARAPRRDHDGLAERGDLARHLGGERPRAELAGRAVGVAEALERELALARGGQRDPGAVLDLRALERHVQPAVELDRARELLGRGVGIALQQRDLGDRVRERRERVGVPGLRGDPGQDLGAGVRAVAVALRGEEGRAPADAADGVVVVVALLPAPEDRAAALAGLVAVALRGRDARERRRWCRRSCCSGRRREAMASEEVSSRRAELSLPSNAWIAPSRPSATNTAVRSAISSRLIAAARDQSPRSRST